MANKLGELFGTEEDKVNCPFYFKIGACRHGDKCIRVHNKPTLSETLLIKNMYVNTEVEIAISEGKKVSEEGLKESKNHFLDFYEEVFLQLCKYGKLEDLNVCDNLGDHLIGNVYVKYSTELEAKNAMRNLSTKLFSERPLVMEYSPVSDFRESRCRQYDDGSCGRGAFCNFMHLKYVSRNFKELLFAQMIHEYPEYKKQKKPEEQKRRRRNSSTSSDRKIYYLYNLLSFYLVVDYSSKERRKLIEKWSYKYDKVREENKKRIKAAEEKMKAIISELSIVNLETTNNK